MLLQLVYIVLSFGSIVGDSEEKFNKKSKDVIYTTAIRALAELREIENSYMGKLYDYTNFLQQKVDTLRKYIDYVTHENVYYKEALGRRALRDWPKWMDYIKELENYDMEEMHKIVNCTPNAEDMQEALLGMDRIEHFYDLQASDMANGLVAGQQFETRMSASDCLALANYMYNQSEFRRAAQWFRLALHYIKVPRNSIVAKFYAPQRQELQKMFLISRLQEGSIDNLNNYLKELSQETENSLTHLRPKPPPNAIERGCRGQFPDRPKLVCRYNTTTTPFMRIAPLKEEEISRNPLIWLYHDVISDNEIVEITNLTRDDMIEGFTDNYTTPEQENRIFQVKIFEGVGGKLDKALVNRMADISGLNVGNHTELAIINYGLGSYFQEHSDYRDLQMHPELMEEGNRLFTFLFYMTDVPVGGATIFPAINITIQPKKGAALFWYNLHNNCEPNPLARHAVCPMIMGNRWVLTKSMLNYDQMFIKPCYK